MGIPQYSCLVLLMRRRPDAAVCGNFHQTELVLFYRHAEQLLSIVRVFRQYNSQSGFSLVLPILPSAQSPVQEVRLGH